MDIQSTSQVGKSGLVVTKLGLGTAALGYLYQPVEEDEAVNTIMTAYNLGIRWFDTAPLYGQGRAELRLGMALKSLPREEIVIATKVGYVIPESGEIVPQDQLPRDYSYDGVLYSVEHSLRRLGCDRVDLLQIHDPDDHYDAAMQGTYKALRRLREEGTVQAIGVGMNQSELLVEFAKHGEFDSFLLAGRYTLLDQSAEDMLLPIAAEQRISILVGGPFNSGILADPWAERPMFNYQEAGRDWVLRAQRLGTWCREEGIPLKAAALQFPLNHPAVSGVLVGARSSNEIEENVAMARYPIPEEFWESGARRRLIGKAKL